MKDFVDHGLGHPLKGDVVVFRKMFEGLQGFLNFEFGNMLHFGSQRHDGGYNAQAFIPLAELNDGLVHDAFPFDSLPVPVLDVFIDDIFQVIDIIYISIAQAIDFRIDVAGNGDVDEKNRPVFADAHDRFHLIAVQDESGCAGRADDDVHFFQTFEKLLQAGWPCH